MLHNGFESLAMLTAAPLKEEQAAEADQTEDGWFRNDGSLRIPEVGGSCGTIERVHRCAFLKRIARNCVACTRIPW